MDISQQDSQRKTSINTKNINNQQTQQYEYIDKPSKIQRMNNMRHKKNQLKKYITLCKWEDTTKKHLDTLTNCNFKKTTAFKKKYSCHGYGGKCGMCSSNYNQAKKFVKQDIQYGNSKLSLCLPNKIVTL